MALIRKLDILQDATSCNIIFVLLLYIRFKISSLSRDKDHRDGLLFLENTVLKIYCIFITSQVNDLAPIPVILK